ncbi:helix-turn-helix domain-containing protein [Rhizorhabdus histidinilytica]
MAEATGLTPVHVNRTLQEMRSEGLIILKERVLDIPDIAALQQAVLFLPLICIFAWRPLPPAPLWGRGRWPRADDGQQHRDCRAA